MTENALCADPATSGSASAGHDGTAADPARARRRLSPESFKALTARLKAAGEPAPRSEPSTSPAPQPLAYDEPMPVAPLLEGDDAEKAALPAAHQVVNGEQTAASAATEPDRTETFAPFETVFDEAEAGPAAVPLRQALPPELHGIFADTAADEPGEAPKPASFPIFDDTSDASTICETPQAREQASPFEPAEEPQDPHVGAADGVATAEAPEFDQSLEELPASRAPDNSQETLAPEPGERTEEPSAGEPAELLEQIKSAVFAPAAHEPEDAVAAPSEPGLLGLADLPTPAFTDELEAAMPAADSEAASPAAGGEDEESPELSAEAEAGITAMDDAGDEAAEVAEAVEPTVCAPDDAVAAALLVEDYSEAAAVEEHGQTAGDVAETSVPGLPGPADLPAPVFADELEAAIPAADAEAGSPAAGAEDEESPGGSAGAEASVAAADEAGDETAGEPQPIEPAAAASEAPVVVGEGADLGDDTPGSLQDMLHQLEGQFGSFADTDSNDGDDEAAQPAVESAPQHVSAPVEGAAHPGIATDDAAAADEVPEASEDGGQAAEDLAALLGSLSARLESVGDRSDEVDESAAAAHEGTDTPEAEVAPDEASGETARMLLDIMSMPSGSLQPQERALAADTLLRLIARMPAKSVLALAERFSLMEEPPGLIIKELIAHPNEQVAAQVLEKCANVTDQDLLELIAHGTENKRLMVARRRHVSSALVDVLIAKGEASVYLTIVRNPGADISYDAFIELCELAKNQPSLQAPLATRANTPAPVAFELFWFLPSELRRYVLSRFLTDSETLTKILKITLAVDASAANDVTERKFPPRARIEELVGLIEEGLTPEASRLMASLSGICEACARRLIADPDGEPLTIVMKAMGATRALFAAAIERWQTSTSAMLRTDRDLDELRNLFDSMSFNKARVLLTYWDWAARKAGPYACRAA